MKDLIVATGVQDIKSMGQAFENWAEAVGLKVTGTLAEVSKKLAGVKL